MFEAKYFMAWTREKQLASQRLHYQQNKELYKQRARAHDKKTQGIIANHIVAYLLENPCVDCNEADPIVLEFDHRDRDTKSFNMGEAMKGYSLAKVEEEIAKCDVRCANCHRRKTYREHGGYKIAILESLERISDSDLTTPKV